jgi:hypothetical protein
MLSDRISQLASPPRPVPLRVACRAMLGIAGSLGAAFLVLGMAGVIAFGGGFHPIDELRLALSTATTQGVVTDVAATNATENQVTVYKYEFTFSTPDGQTVTAHGYATGRLWSPEDRVLVHYVPGKPAVAQMEETRRSLFSPWVFALTLLFPVTGAVLFVLAAVRGVQQVTLLRWGEIAAAQMLSERATNVRVNNVPVIEYAYEFPAHDGETYIGSSRSLPTQHIGDETREPVLYLPSNPRRSTLVDALPLRYPLDVDGYGQWTTRESVWPVVWYALIWGGVVVLGGLILLRLLCVL